MAGGGCAVIAGRSTCLGPAIRAIHGMYAWGGAGHVTASDVDFEDPAFLAQLAALRVRYVAGLPARKAALDEAWGGCTDPGGEASWQRLRDVAHNLSGSAAGYGFDALGDAARDLDRLLSGRGRRRSRGNVEAGVARLARLLDAAIADG